MSCRVVGVVWWVVKITLKKGSKEKNCRKTTTVCRVKKEMGRKLRRLECLYEHATRYQTSDMADNMPQQLTNNPSRQRTRQTR